MSGITLLGALGALGASISIVVLAGRERGIRAFRGALLAAAGGGVITVSLGLSFGLSDLGYLLGVVMFAVPVALLIELAAIAAGADRLARWVLVVTWGLVVFPVAALVPLGVVAACAAPECVVEDFGGSLPLFVSASAFLVLTWISPVLPEALRAESPARLAAALALASGGFLLWLVHLEGALDAYVWRILAAGVLAPVASIAGWVIVDRLRGSRMTAVRILAGGVAAGMVAISPGAVSVHFPWTVIVGLLAGVTAAVIHSSKALAEAGEVARWALALLGAAAIGFLAPPISGDAVGIVFSARIAGLTMPVLSFLAVTVFAIVASTPAWLLLRRHAMARATTP
ncbi:hypothetical protein [uncultured Schumannella sp.]|uniref:hypothetical protein n=1 Tax=uncultured Schumannella sp. TaxID=1195956 RepID=UPI0025FE4285|nr:hypothetical protein [uncultured Schumannella sp.]